jgi:hypothetical protein
LKQEQRQGCGGNGQRRKRIDGAIVSGGLFVKIVGARGAIGEQFTSIMQTAAMIGYPWPFDSL